MTWAIVMQMCMMIDNRMECRDAISGLHLHRDRTQCWRRAKEYKQALEAQAEAIGAKLVRLDVKCAPGRDG